MTLFFQSHSIIIRRQRNKSGLRFAFSATGTVQDIDLQPVEVERIDLVGGRIGKTYEAWIDATVSVKEADQIKVIDTGKVFTVKTVSIYEGAGLLDHQSLILIAQD